MANSKCAHKYIDGDDSNGNSPLHLAAREGFNTIVQVRLTTVYSIQYCGSLCLPVASNIRFAMIFLYHMYMYNHVCTYM